MFRTEVMFDGTLDNPAEARKNKCRSEAEPQG